MACGFGFHNDLENELKSFPYECHVAYDGLRLNDFHL